MSVNLDNSPKINEYAHPEVLVSTEWLSRNLGTNDLVIVESDEVLLVMNKDKEQELKTIVNEIKDRYKGKFN